MSEENFWDWLLEQRSWVAAGLAVIVLGLTLVLRYCFDLWWPWGILAATVLGFVALIVGASE